MTEVVPSMCRNVPVVPANFRPHYATFLRHGHVCAIAEGYSLLVELAGLTERHKFITRGLTPIARRWQHRIPRGAYQYDLSVIRFATWQPNFDAWMRGEREIGTNTIQDVLDFIRALEKLGALDR